MNYMHFHTPHDVCMVHTWAWLNTKLVYAFNMIHRETDYCVCADKIEREHDSKIRRQRWISWNEMENFFFVFTISLCLFMLVFLFHFGLEGKIAIRKFCFDYVTYTCIYIKKITNNSRTNSKEQNENRQTPDYYFFFFFLLLRWFEWEKKNGKSYSENRRNGKLLLVFAYSLHIHIHICEYAIRMCLCVFVCEWILENILQSYTIRYGVILTVRLRNVGKQQQQHQLKRNYDFSGCVICVDVCYG